MIGRYDAQGWPFIDVIFVSPPATVRCRVDTGYKGFLLLSASAAGPLAVRPHVRASPTPGGPPVALGPVVIEWFGVQKRIGAHVRADLPGIGGPDGWIGFLPFWHDDCKLEINWSVKPNTDGGVSVDKN
jgi:hypothetical protein